jgi:cyclophilin family peptidyl-prolyl cis-trans isomerase
MLEPVMVQLLKNYPEDVRVVFRPFPLLEIHPNALLATQAAEAAGKQDKQMFFTMGETLFKNQSTWSSMTNDEFKAWLIAQAETLGLDKTQFTNDLESPVIVQSAQNAHDQAVSMGIPGTPFLLINGVPYPGSNDYNTLEAIIKLVRLQERQYTQCPPMTINEDKQYQATLHTTKGDIVIDLFADKAPVTVNSFIFLAKNGWFDDVPFHRVIPGFVAQTGDPTGSGYGGPGYAFGSEIDPSLKFDKPGMVGMANAGADSNGSQFFITLDAVPQLDGSYTIFGQVTSGMDVVESLTVVDSSKDSSIPNADKILSVSIEEK